MTDAAQTTEQTTTETTGQGVGSGVDTSASAQTPAGSPVDGTPPAYSPNYKFKVGPKEHEIPEWVRPVVKDSDSEKLAREFCEKAYGLDFVKDENQSLKGENQTLKQENTQILEVINQVNGFLQKGDFQSFVEALQIPENMVIQWALEVAQRRKDPQAQAQWQQQRVQSQTQAQREAEVQQLYQQNQTYQQQMQQMATQVRATELNMALSQPNVSEFVKAFDARMGREGAFQDEVINRGLIHFHTTGKDVPAFQVVQEVMQLFQGFTQQAAQPGQVQSAPQSQAAKPVIPNIQGSGASPTKKVPKSIADIRALSQAANG